MGAVGAAAGLVWGVVGFAGLPARAQGDTTATASFSATAEGDGLYVNVLDANLPLFQQISLSPWGAGSQLDSAGDSTAFAGAPDLGSTITPTYGTLQGLAPSVLPDLPNIVVTVLQGLVPVPLGLPALPSLPLPPITLPPLPALPGYVESSYPGTPSAGDSAGVYSVEAASQAQKTSSSVDVGVSIHGGGAGQVLAGSSIQATPVGGYVGHASAGVDGLTIGGVLDIANLTSTVDVTYPPAGKPVIHYSTNLGSIKVAGIPIGVTNNGIEVLGHAADLPSNPRGFVDSILAKAGITLKPVSAEVTYAPGTHQVAAVDSGALEVDLTENVPNEGTVTVQLILARASVGGTAQLYTIPNPPAVGPTSAPAVTSGSPPVGGGSLPVATSSAISASSGAPSGGAGPSGAPGPSLSSSAGEGGSLTSPGAATAGTPARLVAGPGLSLDVYYLILALAGVALAGGALVIGQFAVRLRMTGGPSVLTARELRDLSRGR